MTYGYNSGILYYFTLIYFPFSYMPQEAEKILKILQGFCRQIQTRRSAWSPRYKS